MQTVEYQRPIFTIFKLHGFFIILLEKKDANYAEGIRKTQKAILYLEHLRKSNLPHTVGEKLAIGGKYLLPSCDLVAEVALKLCHTLWRKLFPDELKSADEELINVIFYYLQFEHYALAHNFASFGLSLPKFHSDLHRRALLVNDAIALKFSGKFSDAQKLLKQEDWTSCSPNDVLARRNEVIA